MKFLDIICEIDNIESKYPVNEWKADGIHLWPLLRISIRNQLLYKYNVNSYVEGSGSSKMISFIQSVLKSTFYTGMAFFSDLNHNDLIKGKYDVLFHTVIQDRVWIGDSYYNKLCDPLNDLINDAGLRTFTIESSPLAIKYKYPRYRKSKYIQHFLTWAKIKSFIRVRLLRTHTHQINLENYSLLQNYLLNKYGLIIWDVGKIWLQTDLLFTLKSYYANIIRKTKINLGIITMYYSIDGMAFVLACKEAGVIVCDLQHGVQGDYHVSYGLWNKVPETGNEVLPNYFLCWSDFEADTIKRWNKNVSAIHSPLIIGNLFIEKWKNNTDVHVKFYDGLINSFKNKNSAQTHILYTLQDYSIPAWILEAIKKSSGRAFWWIRMHPEQIQFIKNTTAILQDAGVENYNLIEATNLPLYGILRNINLHVTGWSTTILEALHFGIPSIITDKLGEEMYENEVTKGVAAVAYNPEQILYEINQVRNFKLKDQPQNHSLNSMEFEKVIELIFKF